MITLITDFGLASEYVGVMKGVILSHSPDSSIIDISHLVPPQDILHAAHMIRASFSYFPKGTVHVVVVDPGVGSGRDIVLFELKEHLLLVPDNGVATLLVKDSGPFRVYRVSREDLFLQPVSATFHGRDIFAPVAAKLDAGMLPSEVGPEVNVEDLVTLEIPEPVIDLKRRKINGEVVSIDSFGSLISNIRRDNILDCGYYRPTSSLYVVIGKTTIKELSHTYDDVKRGSLLALVGSRGFLEIAVNGGDASKRLQALTGTKVIVSIR